MDIRIYHEPVVQAMTVRHTVFVEEQGFVDDPDEVDPVAIHLVAFDGDCPIAVCRIFPTNPHAYMLGRFAVVRSHRSQGVGAALLESAERQARLCGAKRLALHSQWHAKGFYERFGYIPHGDIEYEQNQPHIYMEKEL